MCFTSEALTAPTALQRDQLLTPAPSWRHAPAQLGFGYSKSHALVLSQTRCVAVMGNLIPFRGRHYWEVEVDERLDYTVGVSFEEVPKQEDLGTNSLSWCMRHTWASPR